MAMGATGVRGEWDAQKYLVYNFGELSLRPQLEVAETFDSNLFYREEDVESDSFTSVRPGLIAMYGAADRSSISVRYTLDTSYYADRSDLNNVGHLIQHQSRFPLPRLTIQGDDRVSITRTILGGTYSYIEKLIGQVSLYDAWRADYDLSPKTLVGVRAGVQWVDYEAADLPPYHLYDYLSFFGGGRFGYRPSDKLTVFPELLVGQTFVEPNNATAPEGADLTSYSFSVGAEGDFTPKITGLVQAGYEIRSYADDTEVPDSWIATTQVRWQARAKTALALAYRHAIEVSREAVGYAYMTDRATLSISQELGTQGRWIVNLDGYYQFNAYDRDFPADGGLVRRKDDLAGVSARGSFRWKPWLVTSASYDFVTYSDNLSNVQDYDVHRISLRVAAGY